MPDSIIPFLYIFNQLQMESQIKATSTPTIQVRQYTLSIIISLPNSLHQSTSEPSSFPIQKSALLTPELQILMNEVEKLREETNSILCNCSNPCCPFSVNSYEEKYPSKDDEERKDHAAVETVGKIPDFKFGSMETLNQRKCMTDSLPCMIQLRLLRPQHHPFHNHLSNSTSLTNISRGVHKREDGTIVENDYPGFSCSTRKSMKKKRQMGSFTMVHFNCLDVGNMEVPPLADCQVDQDEVISTNKGYRFRREAPERKNVRSVVIPTTHSVPVNVSNDISWLSLT